MWLLPASDQSRCIVDVQQLALSLGLVIAVCAALTVVTIGAFRRICIRDVSLEHGKTRLRTVVHQFLCDAGRTSWPFHLRGCAHPCHEGRRVNGTTLELIDAQGQAISERKDISIGILTPPSFRVFFHTSLGMPIDVWVVIVVAASAGIMAWSPLLATQSAISVVAAAVLVVLITLGERHSGRRRHPAPPSGAASRSG